MNKLILEGNFLKKKKGIMRVYDLKILIERYTSIRGGLNVLYI